MRNKALKAMTKLHHQLVARGFGSARFDANELESGPIISLASGGRKWEIWSKTEDYADVYDVTPLPGKENWGYIEGSTIAESVSHDYVLALMVGIDVLAIK